MSRTPHTSNPHLVLTLAALSAGLFLAGCSAGNKPVVTQPGLLAGSAASTGPASTVTSTTTPVPTSATVPAGTRPVPTTATTSAAPTADLDQSLAGIDRDLADIDHQLTDADHDVATPEGDIR